MQAWREDHERHTAARAEAWAHTPVRPGERLLAVARGAGGELLAATDRALYHRADQAWVRRGGNRGRADWDEQRHVPILSGLTPAIPARTVLGLAKDWDLPAVAADRVSWTSVLDQRISLNGQAAPRVVARRLHGQARLTWLVILDRGLDPANQGFGVELESALTELPAATGLEGPAGSEPGIARRGDIPAIAGRGLAERRAVTRCEGADGAVPEIPPVVVQSRAGAGRRMLRSQIAAFARRQPGRRALQQQLSGRVV